MDDGTRKFFSLEEALEVLGDDDELLLEMGSIFLEQLPQDVVDLRSAVLDGDAERINRTAHRIKGALASLGGSAIAARALLIERAGSDGDVAGARTDFPQFENELEMFRDQLNTHLERISSDTTA